MKSFDHVVPRPSFLPSHLSEKYESASEATVTAPGSPRDPSIDIPVPEDPVEEASSLNPTPVEVKPTPVQVKAVNPMNPVVKRVINAGFDVADSVKSTFAGNIKSQIQGIQSATHVIGTRKSVAELCVG